MLARYPTREDFPEDAAAEAAIRPIKATILGARQIRGQLDVPRSRPVQLLVKAPGAREWDIIQANAALIRFVANVPEILPLADERHLPPTAFQLVDGYAIHAPLSALVDDPDAELARLSRRMTKARQELAKCEAKLANQSFVANAPADVVSQERERITAFLAEIDQLAEQQRRVTLLKG
jgi:valyl-tRNA synthetase